MKYTLFLLAFASAVSARSLRHAGGIASRVRMSSGAAAPSSTVLSLVKLAAVTDRGQSASSAQRELAGSLISELEQSQSGLRGDERAQLEGEWELVYATEAVYRASPFFAAFRRLTEGMTASVRPRGAGSNSLADAIFAVTDAVPFKQVGVARQVITPTELVSRVELSVNVYDALLPRSSSMMTSTCSIVPAADDEPIGWPLRTALQVEQTQVLDSTLGKLLPFLRIDEVRFPTVRFFEQWRAGSAAISMETSYLSQELRISRFELGQAFVWARVG